MRVRFKDVYDSLHAALPLLLPTTVSRRKLKDGLQGYCKISKKYPLSLSIVIDRQLSEAMQADVLIHEWAHGLLATLPDEFAAHGSMWGLKYAQCYVAAYGD